MTPTCGSTVSTVTRIPVSVYGWAERRRFRWPRKRRRPTARSHRRSDTFARASVLRPSVAVDSGCNRLGRKRVYSLSILTRRRDCKRDEHGTKTNGGSALPKQLDRSRIDVNHMSSVIIPRPIGKTIYDTRSGRDNSLNDLRVFRYLREWLLNLHWIFDPLDLCVRYSTSLYSVYYLKIANNNSEI